MLGTNLTNFPLIFNADKIVRSIFPFPFTLFSPVLNPATRFHIVPFFSVSRRSPSPNPLNSSLFLCPLLQTPSPNLSGCYGLCRRRSCSHRITAPTISLGSAAVTLCCGYSTIFGLFYFCCLGFWLSQLKTKDQF